MTARFGLGRPSEDQAARADMSGSRGRAAALTVMVAFIPLADGRAEPPDGAEGAYAPGEPRDAEGLPAKPLAGLRDSLAAKATLPGFLAVFRGKDAARKETILREFGRPGHTAAIPYVGAALLRLNEEPSTRVAAAEALGVIGEARVLAYLPRALADPDARVRMAAVRALGRAAPLGAETLLERALRSDPSWRVRRMAAVALGEMGLAFSVDALDRAARVDEHPEVRLQAAVALGSLGTPRASAALAAPLADDDPGVRVAAALALGRIGGGPAGDLLRGAAARERDVFVRRSMRLGLRSAAPDPKDP